MRGKINNVDLRVRRYIRASKLQKSGLTLTEIAAEMRITRQEVVDLLYTYDKYQSQHIGEIDGR